MFFSFTTMSLSRFMCYYVLRFYGSKSMDNRRSFNCFPSQVTIVEDVCHRYKRIPMGILIYRENKYFSFFKNCQDGRNIKITFCVGFFIRLTCQHIIVPIVPCLIITYCANLTTPGHSQNNY